MVKGHTVINYTHSFLPQLALRNALRYFPDEYHVLLAKEFATELKKYGHIYMYRFIPKFQLR